MAALLKEVFVTDQKKPVIEELGDAARGRLVTELEPADHDGKAKIVTHWRNDTQREIDRLYKAGRLGKRGEDAHERYMAGSTIRDVWEAAGIGPGRLVATSLEQRVMGRHLASDYVAWDEYVIAIKQLGRDQKRVIQDVVLHDMPLDDWGRKWRCYPDSFLHGALDRLVIYYGKAFW